MAQHKTSVTSWKSRKRHTVTLASGTVVDIEIPNLPLLIKIGKIPNHLIESAVKLQESRHVTAEDVAEHYDLMRKLVAVTVKAPELTEEQVDDLPFEDVEMLAQFAFRERDMDAVGHHLGDLEKVESFRDIRGL